MAEEQQRGSDNVSMSLTTGFAEVDGAKLYYEIAGAGRPLVLIQGRNLLGRRVWDDQFMVFAEHYQVVRYDVRGFGNSTESTKSYSQTQDLSSLLKFLSIEKAFLLDLGGIIALEFVLEHPEIVEALILVSSELGGYKPLEEAFEALPQTLESLSPIVEAVKQHDVSRVIDLMMDGPWFPSQEYPRARQRARELLIENSHLLFAHPKPPMIDLEAIATQKQRLSEIRTPTLVIVGDRASPDTGAVADQLESSIIGAKKIVVSGTRYMINMERPEEFNQIVLDFLDKL